MLKPSGLLVKSLISQAFPQVVLADQGENKGVVSGAASSKYPTLRRTWGFASMYLCISTA